jgi:hypothetical protein
MNYMERAEKETKETLERVRRAVSNGMSPTDAINRNAHTAESYSTALKEYGLKPDIPD